MQGIILEAKSNLYIIKNCQKDPSPMATMAIYEAMARGKLKKDDMTPVVGDLVEFEITDEQNKKAIIDKILDRTVYIKRPKISNITQIIFVVSSIDPKPDLLLLDKQLAFAEFLGIKAIIVLNKIDLDRKSEFEDIDKIYTNLGYTVIKTDAKNKKGIDILKEKLKNNINAFSGNSGVGKSTLINGIFDKSITQEGQISKKNKKGKNTTTSIKLYEIDKNTYIADTPGFSTFSIEEINSKDLDKYFIEFKNEIQNCEFIRMYSLERRKLWNKKSSKKWKNRYITI